MTTAKQFEHMTTAELDALACKTARTVDQLIYHAPKTHENKTRLAHFSRRLAAMDAELDRRHNKEA